MEKKMTSFIAKQAGIRLDTIVFEHYGDLSMFDSVLAQNPNLHNVFIPIGFKVFLPEKQVEVSEDVLW